MGIGLMPDIPYQDILRGLKNIMQGQGQFHDTEIERKMTAVLRNLLNDPTTQLPGD
jgi:hypothetical protein